MGSLWKTTTRPNIETPIWETGGEKRAKSGADADNVDSDQAKKAEALTQDHQDKLSQGPPPAGNGEQALLRAPSPRPQPQARTISMT